MRLGELYHFLRFSISKTCGNNIEAFPGGSQESFLRALCALSVTLFFKTCIKAYRAVARRRAAYAAMSLWGYRGVSGFCDPAIRPLPFCAVMGPEKAYRAVA